MQEFNFVCKTIYQSTELPVTNYFNHSSRIPLKLMMHKLMSFANLSLNIGLRPGTEGREVLFQVV
jgi:hypothetical protein